MPENMNTWLRTFIPMEITASVKERILGCLGAFIGIFCTELVSRHLLLGFNPWFIAPMGASAVLLFAVPSSPMAQPWPMLAGNLVSALVGVGVTLFLGPTGFTAAIAVALAIGVMFKLRCLHPPGGAIAVSAVFGGSHVLAMGYHYAIGPVFVNSLLLLVCALVFNALAGRRYPHRPQSHPNHHQTSDPSPSQRSGITHEDLEAVLTARGELLDISKDDLENILEQAAIRAGQRRMGDIRCQDVMSRDVVVVHEDDSILKAWAKLAKHKVKAIPVVDESSVLQGIVSLHDFFIDHDKRLIASPLAERGSQKISTLMTTFVKVAHADQSVMSLAHLFSDGGLHHLPVVDEHRKVIGMLTQSDLVAALVNTIVKME
ncbi:HPP family protein [Leeia oryzae]|uniref:HPP family protein n=1 Tax=Leeia oryzae TaxID=356662 RepID=UPI000366228E|nr:HPP family protein [Leeia oryzae]